MAALGYNECVTYSFIDEAAAKLFGGGDDATRLENPISSEMSHMRPALLPGLLQAAARNQARGMMDLALFEVGHAFHGGEPTEQHLQAVGLLVGQSGPRDPHGAAARRCVRREGGCRGRAVRHGRTCEGPDPARRGGNGGTPGGTG
jgi:phenylalanyl-tRNA synthetase beta chain